MSLVFRDTAVGCLQSHGRVRSGTNTADIDRCTGDARTLCRPALIRRQPRRLPMPLRFEKPAAAATRL